MSKDILRGLMGFAFMGTVCAAVIVNPPALELPAHRHPPAALPAACQLARLRDNLTDRYRYQHTQITDNFIICKVI
jgi:hypothetical protein